MSRFNKEYKRIYYWLSVVIVAVYAGLGRLMLRNKEVFGLWGNFIFGVLTLAVLIALIVLAPWFFKLRLEKQYIALYENACDPEQFLVTSNKIIQSIKAPFSDLSMRFLTYRCLAFYDIDHVNEANGILQAMLNDINKTYEDTERAQKTLIIFPALVVAQGKEHALSFVEAAEAFARQNPRKYRRGLLQIVSQRNIALAQQSGDLYQRNAAWKEYGVQKGTTVRMKAVAAFKESEGYRMLGDTDKEKELLHYVLQHGSKLSVGRKAQTRLTEIEQ